MVSAVDTLTDDLYRRRILVVDDYEATREMIVEALHQSGYTGVRGAADGREALAALGGEGADLVITDVMMPGMNGLDLLENIRERSPGTPVIVVTGKPTTELAVTALKRGAVDFIKKPFHIDDLLYKVQIALRQVELQGRGDGHGLEEEKAYLSVKSYIYDTLENLEGDNERIFDKLVELAARIAEVDACWVTLYDGEADHHLLKASQGTDASSLGNGNLSFLKPFYNQVIGKKEALIINSEEHPVVAPSLICVPLTIRGQAFGVLTARKRKNRGVFRTRDLKYLTSLAKRASLNLENKLLYESLYQNILNTCKSLIDSIQLRDHYTQEHCRRVTEHALRTARSLGCDHATLESLKISGQLHDLGKIAIPDHILLKPDRLADDEYAVIKTHSTVGARILESIALFDRERETILHHHERWDGRGYPDGLQGEEIPLAARIIAVADTYDAITNNRPYRQARDREWAVAQLLANRGTQFDGEVVDHFLKTL
ncbi:MAG TPA: response regulator [Syntrophales bacterium]|nr:response regulator [Syntrophales bacterium]HRV42176.1 response regulator [Syntrophales bacterium]